MDKNKKWIDYIIELQSFFAFFNSAIYFLDNKNRKYR